MASAAVATMRDRPELAMAAIGLLSGVLSAVFGFMFEPEWLKPISALFVLEPGMMPIGLFYGVAIGTGYALCTGRQWAAPLLLVTTLFAWSAAIHTAIWIMNVGSTGMDPTRTFLGSLAAGAIGAGATHIGVALVSPPSRRPLGLALTILVGAVCGLLYWVGELHVISERILCVVWQPAVAYCIGLAMAREGRTI